MQKLFIKIDAESPDGQMVKCETQIKANCTAMMGASVLANIIKQDDNFREMVIEALALCATGKDLSEKVSDEEYYAKTGKNPDSDIEL